ncbi:LapA family protein [Streptomyces sp. NPDC006632]|uniref:LapA family protein n=1 Tax=Streptomyces sp. NPDC006632 TaxID=3157182 RepID=UPI0033B1CD99
MSPRGESSSTRSRAGGVVTPGRIAVLVLAILALVFIFENTRRVKIRLLIPEVTMPLYLALLAVFLVGLCCGYVLRRRSR